MNFQRSGSVLTDDFLPDNCYYKEEHKKTTICLHHTAGGPDAKIVKNVFLSEPGVATAFVLGSEGNLLRVFPENYWACSVCVGCIPQTIPVNQAQNYAYEKQIIAIEICNYGNLIVDKGKFFKTGYGRPIEIPSDQVYDVHELLGEDFKRVRYFQKYTDAQMDTLEKWLLDIIDMYPIDFSVFSDTGDIGLWWHQANMNALEYKGGIWNHNNYRPKDRMDVTPDKRLWDLLNRCIVYGKSKSIQ
jgi:hypothetical protein